MNFEETFDTGLNSEASANADDQSPFKLPSTVNKVELDLPKSGD